MNFEVSYPSLCLTPYIYVKLSWRFKVGTKIKKKIGRVHRHFIPNFTSIANITPDHDLTPIPNFTLTLIPSLISSHP